MKSYRRSLGGAAVLAAVLVACGDEEPTGVGGALVTGGAVRTYQLELSAAEFLVSDSAITGFTDPRDAGYVVLAGRFGGVRSNVLVRFAPPPGAVSYRDTAGVQRSDTLPLFIGGDVLVRLDTLRSRSEGPVDLRLFRIEEEWDPSSADWSLRVDSGAVRQAWAQPGGTPGALLSSATWQPGTDSVLFPVDSQTVALWADTTNVARGALIVADAPGARLRSSQILLRLTARPSPRPDTTVATTAGAIRAVFVYDPPAPADAVLKVGGNPAWRTVLRFQQLRERTVPCPDGGIGCTIRLGSAKINYAALLLVPHAPPAAFAPEDSLRVEARPVLATPGIPLARSPLGDRAAALREPIPVDRFAVGAPATPIEIPVTGFVAGLAGESDGGTAPPDMLALIALPEGSTFGFGAFGGGSSGAGGPRLKIVVTVASEVDIR